MRVLRLPLVAELGDRPLLALGDEDRVETEALGAPPLVDDAALEDAGASEPLSRRRERDQLADIAGSPVLDSLELSQQPLDVLAACEARRLDAGPAAEPVHLETGVLAEDPRRRLDRAAELGLGSRVLVVRRSGFRGILVGVERLDLPTLERAAELAQLPWVL
jgi:hypothetical protein